MKLLKKIGQLLIYLLVFYFIGKIIFNQWAEINSALKEINLYWLILSVVLIFFILIFQSYIWHFLLKQNRTNLHFYSSFTAYYKSLITRYLPGGIWIFLSRLYLTSKLGFKKTQVLFLILVESIITVVTGSLVAFIFQPSSEYAPLLSILFALLFLIGVIFLLSPTYLMKVYYLFLKKEIEIIPLKFKGLITAVIYYLLIWLFSGFWLLAIINSITNIDLSSWLIITGIYSAAWVIGFIIIFIPSGLGIRDIFIIGLLGQLIGIPQAILVTVAARIVYLIGEVSCFVFGLLAEKYLINRKNDLPPGMPN